MKSFLSTVALFLVAGLAAAHGDQVATKPVNIAKQIDSLHVTSATGALEHESVLIGGNSGGGGSTEPSSPITAAQATEGVKEIRPLVYGWFNQINRLYRLNDNGYWKDTYGGALGRPSAALLAKLFDGPKTVYDAMKGLTIEVRKSRPCYTSDGKPVDGSIYGVTPGMICISAANLAQKLNDGNVEKQMAALIAHEITHLVGGNEAEAVAVQNFALFSMRMHGTAEVNEKVFLSGVYQAQNILKTIQWMQDTTDQKTLCRYATVLSDDSGTLFDSVFNEVYNYPAMPYADFHQPIEVGLIDASASLYSRLCQMPTGQHADPPQPPPSTSELAEILGKLNAADLLVDDALNTFSMTEFTVVER